MSNVIVIGSQWGDEGKGKVVDWLSNKADAVIRFQGGHNAGHTLVVDGKIYKLSLLPSGIVRGKKSFIGNGVVLDLWALAKEIKEVSEQGININKELLSISETTSLILSYHRELDTAREHEIDGIKIGTTGRGIGPAYEDKVGRRAIRLCDIFDNKNLKKKIENALFHHNPIRKGLGINEIKSSDIINQLNDIASFIKPYVSNIWKDLIKLQDEEKNILFEGAQGMMLDNDHGTYPFVTSSNTISAQASIGTGLGFIKKAYTLGITKAYLTRVGEGPFPTEQNNSVGEKLGLLGNEFGTVTGRKRRCGWLDLVLLKQSVDICGIEGIALTKLDVLDSFEKIKICVSYKLNEKKFDYLPPIISSTDNFKKEYIELDGWNESTRSCRNYNDLPKNAKKYVSFLKELTGIDICLLSTSPEREDTILFNNPFK